MVGWWKGNLKKFHREDVSTIVGDLISEAAEEGWKIEHEQVIEWRESIKIIKDTIEQKYLLTKLDGIILEYDFKRRGLRMDAIILFGENILILEFKRNKLESRDIEQVINYGRNLCEFHEVTQDNIQDNFGMVIPILVSREDKNQKMNLIDINDGSVDFMAMPNHPILCNGESLREVLIYLVGKLNKSFNMSVEVWEKSLFKPSSTIIDAAISLYGNHDVSGIKDHGSQIENIKECTDEIKNEIIRSRQSGGKSLIFLSGTPGSGKTLVGLDITFSLQLRDDTVFVTGNAHLVDILKEALSKSYRKMSDRKKSELSGFSKEGVDFVEKNTVFKIEKAHNFLKNYEDSQLVNSKDGSILIIDEAQRTYEKDRIVLGKKLPDHEANLILEIMEMKDNPIIILLIGHNQHINKGERGTIAWLEGAEKYGWNVLISNETLDLWELKDSKDKWINHRLRKKLNYGHLGDSIRYYHNMGVEKWVHEMLNEKPIKAKKIADGILNDEGDKIIVTRSLKSAKKWVRERMKGGEQVGMLASSDGRRLEAEGIYANFWRDKKHLINWLLAPLNDVRSSNMLEMAQNQFKIQGLELDYTLVCWDIDLRMEKDKWVSFKFNGDKWKKNNSDEFLDIRKNGYRVLLTRARKGMIIFVPMGDRSDPLEDITRNHNYYDGVFDYLIKCGAIYYE